MKINYTAKENLIFLPDREWVLFGVRRWMPIVTEWTS
jgi:hypothetical protein